MKTTQSVRRRFILILAITIITATVFSAACNRSTGGDKKVISVIPKGVSHFFWKSVEAGALAAGREFGVEVRWKGPAQETDYTGQINIVEDAINGRVDGIVLAPSHGEALVPMVLRAQREGIPVVIFDSGITTDEYISYIATDNRQGGVVGAERLAEKIGGKGKVAILGVKKGSVSTDQREEGFQKTIEEKYPDIQIVQFLYGEADRAKSLDRATDILTAHPDLAGIFASNESSSVGAVQAIKQKGLIGKVVLVGFDSSPNLIEDLRAGALDSLVLQNPYRMGYEGVRTIVEKLTGKDVPRLVDTGVKLLTADNIDTPEMQQLIRNP
ncbi:MAG: substrate-binding domain-containing protein [Acidobacteria bacterium]|nr:substrate-binding domain-containing protein [Acidobacteriota bacterium]MCW5966970.1 substrate-binding domain-containing protein [Blastocatellales bacterium]